MSSDAIRCCLDCGEPVLDVHDDDTRIIQCVNGTCEREQVPPGDVDIVRAGEVNADG